MGAVTRARAKTPEAPRRNRAGYYPVPAGTMLPDGTVLDERVDCMSVTTIISNGVPKPALVHWAASEVARCALDNLPRLVKVRGQAARDEAFDWLRRAAEQKRDTAANLGTAVHDVVEANILGAPWPELPPEQEPFLEAFANFVADHAPVWEATEMVLANLTDRWAGKCDAVAHLPRVGDGLTLIDWKTGKGVYGDAALQLSAYQRAQVGWTKDGQQITPPVTVRAVVVHLRPEKYPDRGYAVYPAKTGDDVYASFLAARDVALDWVKGAADTALSDPLPYPDTPEEA